MTAAVTRSVIALSERRHAANAVVRALLDRQANFSCVIRAQTTRTRSPSLVRCLDAQPASSSVPKSEEEDRIRQSAAPRAEAAKGGKLYCPQTRYILGAIRRRRRLFSNVNSEKSDREFRRN